MDAKCLNGKPVDHVIVVMLENRGFDHFMGWLYEGQDKRIHPVPPPSTAPPSQAGLRAFEGLEGLDPRVPLAGRAEPLPLHKGARASNVPSVNPHEDFIHVFEQLYNQGHEAMGRRASRDALVKRGGAYKVPSMDGWVNNYRSALVEHGGKAQPSLAELSEILDIYTPEQLPVLSGLARHYAVSDQWFCSVPSQTNTNRAFYLAGTARGLVTNGFLEFHTTAAQIVGTTHADALPYGTRHLFDVLDEHGVSWSYFWDSPWPPPDPRNQYARTMFSLYDPKYDTNFQKFEGGTGADDFVSRLAQGRLPAVSIIEPHWGGGGSWDRAGSFALPRVVGNEFHPVSDTVVGEFFVKRLYDLVSRSPAWERTLLLLTFDEHGGTYDHVAPPPAGGSSSRVARPSLEPTVNGLPKLPGEKGAAPFLPGEKMMSAAIAELDKETYTQFGFEYDLLGVRVPTLVISPYVVPRTVFRSPTDVPFDHCSIISTILGWQGIPPERWGLGDRVAQAPSFESVLQGVGADGGPRPRADAQVGVQAYGRARRAEAALNCGDRLRLRWVGNPWGGPAVNPGRTWLGGPDHPDRWVGYWYPIMVGEHGPALQFQLQRTPVAKGAVSNGASVEIVVANSPATTRAVGYKLAVPDKTPLSVADTVWLTRETGHHTRWRVWLLDERVDGSPLYPGDRVMLFSERYLPANLLSGSMVYDPYMRLYAGTPGYPSYLGFRAGHWDVWEIVR